MTHRARRRWPWLAAAGAGAIIAVASLATRDPAPPPAEARARAAAERFFDAYLSPEGRVIRRDQGGDTVSEGQAYAMLLAAGAGDRERFESAWRWTRANLQRRDGLLSFLWRDGRVQDPQPAADADLDAARALLLAAERFQDDGYRGEGLRIARGILRSETVVVSGRPLVVAGPWARSEPYAVNPSYFSPRAFAELGRASGDRRFGATSDASYRLVAALTAAPPALAPDWARVEASGKAEPAASIGQPGRPPLYGFNAFRVQVRMAEDCAPAGRRLAARAWEFFRTRSSEELVAEYELSGEPVGDDRHATMVVAAAAAALAAGDRRAGHDLLDRAEALERDASTYYGAAWVAVGRMMLTTDMLGSCPR